MSNTRTPVSFWLGLYKMLLPFDYYAFLVCNLFVLFLVHLWISLSSKVSSEFKYYLSSESVWIEEVPPGLVSTIDSDVFD